VLAGGLRVNDGDAWDVYGGGVAKDDEIGKALADDLPGGGDGTWVIAFGQDDGLLVCLGGGLHAIQEITH